MYQFLLFSFSFFICHFWWGNLPKGTEKKDFHIYCNQDETTNTTGNTKDNIQGTKVSNVLTSFP